MENIDNLKTDHDILITLVANVKSLKESQENFHVEIKESIRDLKDNYATRLDYVEKCQRDADRVFIAKSEQDIRDVEFNKRINKFENRLAWLERIAYTGIGILMALEFYFRYFSH
jgi:BMFP domain-containing protein YqiC